jgi:hypothetical protein
VVAARAAPVGEGDGGLHGGMVVAAWCGAARCGGAVAAARARWALWAACGAAAAVFLVRVGVAHRSSGGLFPSAGAAAPVGGEGGSVSAVWTAIQSARWRGLHCGTAGCGLACSGCGPVQRGGCSAWWCTVVFGKGWRSASFGAFGGGLWAATLGCIGSASREKSLLRLGRSW